MAAITLAFNDAMCHHYWAMKLVDLVGQTFGRLTVIGRGKDHGSSTKWLCKCSCGSEIKAYKAGDLRSKNSQSCGCLRRDNGKAKIHDLTGRVFGKLRVLSRAPNKGNNTQWFCACSCGVPNRAYGAAKLVGGEAKSCGCSRQDKILPDSGAAWNSLFASYRAQARDRGIEFNLTHPELKSFATSPCFYCGREWSNVVRGKCNSVQYNGIDRLDNKVGYLPENCVACCNVCNRMKGVLDLADFISHVRRIVAGVSEFNVDGIEIDLTSYYKPHRGKVAA